MLGDARLVDLFSVGPILEGIGLNVTVWSYQDRVNVTVSSCPDLVHDLGALLAQFEPALKDLT
jgi:diacylglycerol O-acyltransferase